MDSCVPAKLIESDSRALSHVARKRKQKQKRRWVKKNVNIIGSCSAMMSKHIPDELIVEILQLLPVKSLLRFRAVSKDIGAHVDSQNKMIFSDKPGNKFHVCDVHIDPEQGILHLLKSFSSELFEVYGYCHGLIILNRGHRDDKLFRLTLWNPITRKYNDLPYCPAVKDGFQISSTTWLGFVYDDYIDDYKVFIRVSYRRNVQIHIYRSYEEQVWVYELKSNIWRNVENSNNRLRFKFNGIGCFTNGSLHWLSEDNKETRKIDAFDVRKETFYLVPLPDCKINLMSGFSSKLHDVEGCLCISYFSRYRQFKAALYMRKKDGDQFTWIQLYSFRRPILPMDLIKMFSSGTIKVIGYPKRVHDDKAKILLHLGNKDYMVSYDVEKKSFGKVKIVNKDPTWVSPFFLY